ncbi:MAG: glycine betaine ABC transporter substrate-binding protein [Egibacteraceae bacterium]
MRALRCLAALLAAALFGAGCAREPSAVDRPVTLGVGSTDEQRVLAALTITALTRAGIPVAQPRTELGGTQGLRQEARRGGIDLYWDYTGAAWSLGLGQQNPPADPRESYERVAEEDAAQGLVWLAPSGANATLALFVRAADRPEGGTMTELARELSAGGRRLCADPDFIDRPAGYSALAEEYSIRALVPLRRASEPESIAAVADGSCFAGLATATSGEARRAALVLIADDQRVFPAFIAAPVVRADVLAQRPALAQALAPLAAALTTDRLATLNAQLIGNTDPVTIAEAFLGPA